MGIIQKMVKGVGVAESQKKLRQFYIVGRALATEGSPDPTLYRMRVFARDAVLARSKFWYFMKRQHKVRKIQGEIISTSEIYEKKTGAIRNYGIILRYLTRTGTVNMYKEYRDVSLCGAVSQMYMEMAGRHSAAANSIQIIRTSVLEPREDKSCSSPLKTLNSQKRTLSDVLPSRLSAAKLRLSDLLSIERSSYFGLDEESWCEWTL